MSGPGGGGREELRGMNGRRCMRGGDAERKQRRGGDDAVCHPECAVDRLSEEADKGEEKEVLHVHVPCCEVRGEMKDRLIRVPIV